MPSEREMTDLTIPEQKVQPIKTLIDKYVDEWHLEGTVQHKNVMFAIGDLVQEANRRNLLREKS